MRTHVRKCANVCKLISGIGRRLEDILGTRAVVGFFWWWLMGLALEEYIMSLHFVIPCYE